MFSARVGQPIARLELTLRMRPIGLDVLQDLVASGHLSPDIVARMPTLTVATRVANYDPMQRRYTVDMPNDPDYCAMYKCMIDPVGQGCVGSPAAAVPVAGSTGSSSQAGSFSMACVESLPASCTPSISPTFSSINDKVFQQSCGVFGQGGTCHGAEGRQGGLGLFDADTAYTNLLDTTGRARVVAGNPKCSILMERLDSSDTTKRMPLNGPQLDPGIRCAIQQWIEAGASRN
jgi:hypothetical protein